MIVIRISGPSGQPAELKIDAPWHSPGALQLRCRDRRDGALIRDWLRDQATGLFGHLIGSDQVVIPSDLHYACFHARPPDWPLRPFLRHATDPCPAPTP